MDSQDRQAFIPSSLYFFQKPRNGMIAGEMIFPLSTAVKHLVQWLDMMLKGSHTKFFPWVFWLSR